MSNKTNKISVDFNNMMADRIGKKYGISQKEIDSIIPKCKTTLYKMESHDWGFMKLPYNNNLVSKIDELSKKLKKKYNNLVIVGIGGSALGNRTLYTALPPKDNKKQIFVLDNVDPDSLKTLIKKINFKHTLFNVITKSGGTAETMANFMVLRKILIEEIGYEKHKEHIIVTTDPQKSTLLDIAKDEGYLQLEIPTSVGGRFSVLSSVGLLSASFGGIDIGDLLEGAKYMDKLCHNDDLWQNPACMSAILQYLSYKKGRNICVFMPYVDRLKDLSEWYAQLWAESLGKTKNIGSTPVKALGVTDQHSQLQLYMEGPQDKIIVFVKVNNFDNTISIPKEFQKYKKVGYLGELSLNELIEAEQKGTELALAKNSRPNYTITLDKISPFTIGSLLYMLEMQTAFIGELFGIDTFNQPGVELSKQLTCALIGRPGYEEKKKEIEQLPELNNKYCIKC